MALSRRSLLELISRILAACVAILMGVPGLRFMLGSIQSQSSRASEFSRVIRAKDLVPGRPKIVPIMGQKQDAWARFDREVIGRVWLVREASGSEPANSGDFKIRALSSICPHMGCQIQAVSGSNGFVCPCHRANFDVDGQRLADPRTSEQNPAPRGLDDLDYRVVQDESSGEWWVEVKYNKFKTGLNHRVVTA